MKYRLLKPLNGLPIGSEIDLTDAEFNRLLGKGAVAKIAEKAEPAPANKMARAPANKSAKA